MNVWCWFDSNSAVIQGIAALSSVALAAVTISVLVVTWKAIKRQAIAAEEQAKAARALTQVAKDQTKAAIDAADSARKQSDLLSSQIEQSSAPLLVVEPDERQGWKNCKLVNRGPGVAFKIFYWNGELELKNQGPVSVFPVRPSTLGPGNFAYLQIPHAWEVITIQYKGVDRNMRWTVYYLEGQKPQEHVVQSGLQEFNLS